MPSRAIRTRVPIETMPLGAAPGTQIDVQLRPGARDDDRFVGSRLPQGAFDEEIPAFLDSESFEIYLHRARESWTNASIVLKRSIAAASCA